MKLNVYTPHSIESLLVCSDLALSIMAMIVKDVGQHADMEAYCGHKLAVNLIEEHRLTLEHINKMIARMKGVEEGIPNSIQDYQDIQLREYWKQYDIDKILTPTLGVSTETDGYIMGVELGYSELNRFETALIATAMEELGCEMERVEYQDHVWSCFVQD